MNKPIRRAIAEDLRGLNQLAISATTGITDLVEAVHHNVIRVPGSDLHRESGRTGGISGFIYRTIRATTHAAGHGIDAALSALAPHLGRTSDRVEREHVISALNGVIGDHLQHSGNPLAIAMCFRQNGVELTLDAEAIAQAVPQASGKIVVLVHGLCMNDRQWRRKRADGTVHDHGTALQQDFGSSPIYLHYNSGLSVSDNGRLFDRNLEALIQAWPVEVEELVIIAHSMGGLVTRSAYHHGSRQPRIWPKHVKKMIFLGTPHHGAPLERGGHWIDLILGATPFAAPFTKLGKIRSIGITDLRHGNTLAANQDSVPLPDVVDCLAIAGQMHSWQNSMRRGLIGDGLVPVDSALGLHRDPERNLAFSENNRVLVPETNHMQLLSNQAVYAAIKKFMA